MFVVLLRIIHRLFYNKIRRKRGKVKFRKKMQKNIENININNYLKIFVVIVYENAL